MSTAHDPVAEVVAALEAGGYNPRPSGPDQWASRCPVHRGNKSNLVISRGSDGRALVHCHHSDGCGFRDILAALNITPARPSTNGHSSTNNTMSTSPAAKKPKTLHPSADRAIRAARWTCRDKDDPNWKPDGIKVVGRWTYHGESGEALLIVVRFLLPDGSKSYSQVHPVEGGWHVGMPPGPRPLYRLPAVLDADRVFFTEGERCADAVAALGLAATTTPGGAKGARKANLEPLRGRHAVVLPDNDQPGREYAATLIDLLTKAGAASVKTVTLPNLPDKGDVVDWLESVVPDHWGDEDCRASLERMAAHPIEPTPDQRVVEAHQEIVDVSEEVEDEPRGFISNGVSAGDRDGDTEPLSVQDIDAQRIQMLGNWPKRVNEQLFVVDDERVVYLNSPPRLFARFDARGLVDWRRGGRFITQERYHEHLKMTAERYDAVESLPHWPSMKNTYYIERVIPRNGNGALDKLLDFYKPATPLDRLLIKSYALTLFWGGLGGQRPAFLIEGEDGDPKKGRGIGKTTIPTTLGGGLTNGVFSIEAKDDVCDVKTRLLSPDGLSKRACLFDNVKSSKLSWDGLEGLITAPTISGRTLYVGESSRPNTLTWALTVNGAALCEDMTQRVVPIKLRRPDPSPMWTSDVARFIDDHRLEIIADIRDLLEAPSLLTKAASRWGEWEYAVLGKFSEWRELQALIAKRRETVNTDDEEMDLVQSFICERLEGERHSPERDKVFIPNVVMADWVSKVTGKNRDSGKTTHFLKGLSISNLTTHRVGHARGWLWTGIDSEGADLRFVPEPAATRRF